MAFAEVTDEGGLCVEVIDRDIEEALNLRGVEIHGQDAVDSGRGQKVCDEFRGDGHTRLVLSVLTGVAKEWHDCRDPLGTGAPGCIDEDEQLHDVVVRGRTGWLNDENILTADVLIDFDGCFPVGKGIHLNVCERLAELIGYFLGECAVGCSTDDFHEQGDC